MFVHCLPTKKLSHLSYIVESRGEAVVIDPQRAVEDYLSFAAQRGGLKIVAVLLTHVPEDFVAGHVELAAAVGVRPHIGAAFSASKPGYHFDAVVDGQIIYFGDAVVRVVATPGHSAESVCYVAGNVDKPHVAVFTGDTLLCDDIGRTDARPDLAAVDAAAQLHASLRKLAALDDEAMIYPSHDKGCVSCVFQRQAERASSTLKHEKQTNTALRLALAESADVFCASVLQHQFALPPTYFAMMLAANRAVPSQSFADVLRRLQTRLSVADLDALWGEVRTTNDADCDHSATRPLLLDMRTADEYCRCHVPGSVFLGLDEGNCSPYLATALPNSRRAVIVLAPDDARLPEIARVLGSMGYDNVLGHVDRGFWAWKEAGRPVAELACCTVDELAEVVSSGAATSPSTGSCVVDCRRPHEFNKAHIKGAQLVPMEARALPRLDFAKRTIFCYCRGGYRSVMFLSIAAALHGFQGRTVNVLGGFEAMEKSAKCAPLLTPALNPLVDHTVAGPVSGKAKL